MMNKYGALLLVLFLLTISSAQISTNKSVYALTGLTGATARTTLSSDKNAVPKTTSPKNDSVQNSSPYEFPYFIAGDAIKISVYPDTSLFLNGDYNIDQKGFIDLPIIGLVSVTDKTRNELIDYLKNQYSDYLRYPNINVSTYMRVSFFGGFYKPGLYMIESRLSLWDAIQLAGGVNREDGLKKIRWERDGKVISYNITPAFQTGASLHSIGFLSGDQLCVTEKPKKVFWESFRDDAIPILAFSFTALTTALTAYQTYKVYYNK